MKGLLEAMQMGDVILKIKELKLNRKMQEESLQSETKRLLDVLVRDPKKMIFWWLTVPKIKNMKLISFTQCNALSAPFSLPICLTPSIYDQRAHCLSLPIHLPSFLWRWRRKCSGGSKGQ